MAPRDGDDCDSWSEPDLDVSQARIGLGRSSLEPPQRPRCGATYESDASSGEAEHRHQLRTTEVLLGVLVIGLWC